VGRSVPAPYVGRVSRGCMSRWVAGMPQNWKRREATSTHYWGGLARRFGGKSEGPLEVLNPRILSSPPSILAACLNISSETASTRWWKSESTATLVHVTGSSLLHNSLPQTSSRSMASPLQRRRLSPTSKCGGMQELSKAMLTARHTQAYVCHV